MKIIGSYPNLRLRRLRKSTWIRDLVSESNISHKDLILPIFIREGKNKVESIKLMPGVKRYTVDKLSNILKEVERYKIPMVALFPFTPSYKKDEFGTEALNPNNLICKAIEFIKKKFPKKMKNLNLPITNEISLKKAFQINILKIQFFFFDTFV